MATLIELVKKLEEETNEEKIVAKLQKIEKEFLNNYIIKVGNTTIEPLLVEAYYYNPGVFDDISSHSADTSKACTFELARKRQKNHFGELYVHYRTDDGFDIVLSDGDYYLSFLIKNALVNGELMKQQAITIDGICGKCDERSKCEIGYTCAYYGKCVLERVPESKNYDVVFTKRKGLTAGFANELLAAVPIQSLSTTAVIESLEDGYKTQWVAAVRAIVDGHTDLEDARDYISKNNWYTYRLEEKYWLLARESLLKNNVK